MIVNKYCLLCLLSVAIVISCTNAHKDGEVVFVDKISILEKKINSLSVKEIETWYFNDPFRDTVPGVSLYKANEFLKSNSNPDSVIVAVIDMAIDTNHKDLKEGIWTNSDEVANNGIDDDNNGYIDDVNGWNFLGTKNGSSIEFTNYEYTRILKKYKGYLEGRKDTSLLSSEMKKEYSTALEKYVSTTKYAEGRYKINKSNIDYIKALDSVALTFFPNKNYKKSDLDSLIQLNKMNMELTQYLESIQALLESESFKVEVEEQYLLAKERIEKLLNLDYDERAFIGDNPEVIEDIGYGNHIVNHNVKRMSHGTLVSGILAANRNNDVGAMGIFDKILVMPLVVSGYGDEHDKDMALAIRYAVDNGAKVINISSGKYFSMHEDWILDAIKYAAKKNVLIVHSAGNDNIDLDDNKNFFYPNDIDTLGKEVANNFITVGSSNKTMDKEIKASSSSYGKLNVDVFAPGVDIYTTVSGNIEYDTKSGTSCAAPMVSGIAALIMAYYPSLKANEVKDIILQSSIRYDILVEIEKDSLVPFHTLSKSGGIVNAYNAILLADTLSKD